MVRRLHLFGLALLALVLATSSVVLAEGSPPFSLKEGDRVVLLGGTFIERDQAEGYLETLLTSRFPSTNVTFRNLGWSGDTVSGIARARFGKQSDGFAHLKEHVEALKPTVLIVSYGQNESFEGEPGLPAFRAGLASLLKVLDGTGARIVFISPIRHEDLGRPLPDPAKHNANLYLYVDALKKVASERGYGFVDLFQKLEGAGPLTDNGIHLTPSGYWRAAEVTRQELGLEPKPLSIILDTKRAAAAGEGVTLKGIKGQGDAIAFSATLDHLPVPPPPKGGPAAFLKYGTPLTLNITGLADGAYTIKIDGKPVAKASSKDGKLAGKITSGPDFDQAEALRNLINAKNELYFYRWRPQNETYLFGFRKQEQGQNAREIPMFDPLVTAKEAEIAKLRLPQSHAYEIHRAEEVNK